MPQPGVVYCVGAGCGVPFTFAPILFRLIRVEEHRLHSPTAWLRGYETDTDGYAIQERQIYVILAGLHSVAAQPGRMFRHRFSDHAEARNTAAARLPRPRISPETTRRNR